MFFSDVTISYNNKEGLKATLDSFLGQNSADFQIIVVDGGSVDGSVELLEKYQRLFEEKRIAFEYVSEKDSGRYNAMNKGIARACGDWLMFMNAGDILASEAVLESVSKYISDSETDYDIIYGDNLRIYGDDQVVRKPATLESIDKGLPFCHQSVFVKREHIVDRGYDESLVISGDYEWFLYAYKKGLIFYYIPELISIYDTSGISAHALYNTYKEALIIRERYHVSDNAMVRLMKGLVWKVLDVLGISRKQIDMLTISMRNHQHSKK